MKIPTMKIIILLFLSVTCAFAQSKKAKPDSVKGLIPYKTFDISPVWQQILQEKSDAVTKAIQERDAELVKFLSAQQPPVDPLSVVGGETGMDYKDAQGKVKTKMTFTINPTENKKP